MVSLITNALTTPGINHSATASTPGPKRWPLNADKLRTSLKETGFNGKIVARCDSPPVYEAAKFRWSENYEGLPALVVYPESEEDVPVVVRYPFPSIHKSNLTVADGTSCRSSSPQATE